MIGMPGGRGGILNLAIKDKVVLYQAFMPFIKNGGIFIPTNKAYKMGEEVFMLLSLMNEPEKIPVAGKIVWMTPKGAGTNKVAGVGVHDTQRAPRAAVVRAPLEHEVRARPVPAAVDSSLGKSYHDARLSDQQIGYFDAAVSVFANGKHLCSRGQRRA